MPPTTPNPWPTLVARIQSAQPQAIDVWYRRDWPAVYRLCLGFLADHSAAEDAAQDGMLRLVQHLEGGARPDDYEKWRTAIVLNLCRDALRRRASRDRAESEPTTRTPLPDPSDIAARAEVRDALQGALRQLPEREREAFVLRDLEGLATDEVARIMDIGASSVRSLLTLARRRLRAWLGPRLPELAGEGGTP